MKTLLATLCIAGAVAADVATLGGTINDGYFRNGRRSYTAAVVRALRNGSRK